MHSTISTCTCGHADVWHVQKVGPCTHHQSGEFCGCDHFQILRVQAPPNWTVHALPMKKTTLPDWARQK